MIIFVSFAEDKFDEFIAKWTADMKNPDRIKENCELLEKHHEWVGW